MVTWAILDYWRQITYPVNIATEYPIIKKRRSCCVTDEYVLFVCLFQLQIDLTSMEKILRKGTYKFE